MCHELGVNSAQVERIGKLPNTKLRRDIEVYRLHNYTELELVLCKWWMEYTDFRSGVLVANALFI